MIESLRFYEVQDVLNLTGHLVQSTVIMVSGSVWENLDASQQDAVTHGLEEAGVGVAACVEEEEQELLEQWRSEGVFDAIVDEDEIDRDAFAQQAADILPDEFADEWGDGLFDDVRELSTQ